METNEVSFHQVRIFRCLSSCQKWITAKDVATQANVAPRTARDHLSKLVKLGIVDLAEVFPSHRYRLSKYAEKRNKAYLQRIRAASDVFGQEGQEEIR